MAEKVKKEVKNPALVSAVKAVAVLVIICLICGLLLALCNDLLYVSDDEKLSRAMKKIYSAYQSDDEFNKNFKLENATNSYGTITEVKKSTDGAYVISAKGGGGYKGTVTVYVVVGNASSGKDVVIKAWTVKEHDGETFLGNITDTHKSTWYVNKSITAYNDADFALSNNKVSGTTLSSTAINNAVKAACVYCIDVLKLVSTPESEARDAVVALLGSDYDGYTFTSVADADGFSEFTIGDGALLTLGFYFEGTKDGADTLEAYVYGEGQDRQIVVVTSGLTHEERLAADVVAQSDNASEAVVSKVKGLSYFEYLVHKSHEGFEFAGMGEVDADFTAANGTVNKIYTSTDGSIVIEATGTGGYQDGTVTINVVIADGVIKGWWIVSHEKQSFLPNIINSADAKNWYVGTSIDDDIELGNNKVTGTTMSSTAINNAINTACSYARSLTK